MIMKRLSKLIFITVLFMVGLISVEAKPFKIGEATLLEATYKDGRLTFETDRFSQYVYGYSDTVSNIPQTGDNIALYVVLFIMSALGITGTIILSKKKLFNVNK